MRQPCLQLLTARRLNDYRLPSRCFVVACVNPPDSDYDVDPMDPALASRFVRFDVHADPVHWATRARQHHVPLPVVRFVERFPSGFEKAPPRSWTRAGQLIEAALSQGWSTAELEPLLAAVLPPMAAKALAMELPESLPAIDPRDVLDHPDRWVASFDAWTRSSRLDILSVLVDGLRAELRRNGPPDPVPPALYDLLDVLPTDLGLPLLRTLKR